MKISFLTQNICLYFPFIYNFAENLIKQVMTAVLIKDCLTKRESL